MFKIVTIMENRQAKPYCVPAMWVKGHTLYWPPVFTEEQVLEYREKCIPPDNYWHKLKCTPTNCEPINTFKAGLKWEKIFSKFEDTEDEHEQYSSGNDDVKPIILTDEDNVIIDQPPVKNEVVNFGDLIQQLLSKNKELRFSVDSLKQSNAEINAKLDKVLCLLGNRANIVQDERISDEVNDVVPTTKAGLERFSFPLRTVKEATEFNEALADKQFKSLVFQHVLDQVGTNNGEVTGFFLNKIGNEMFTDDLLTKYTFKGISRNGECKESFSDLKNVISLFQNILKTIDSSFDNRKTHNYLQGKFLRHSSSRAKRSDRKRTKFLETVAATEDTNI